MEPAPDATARTPAEKFYARRRRFRVFGLSLDQLIQAFFGGNALVAVIVLTLITVFLFKEGFGFFGQNLSNLRIYRQAGLEYVDILRAAENDHTALNRYLNDLRLRAFRHYTDVRGLDVAAANERLAEFDAFSGAFSDAIEPLRGYLAELSDVVSAVKVRHLVNEDRLEERRQLVAAGRPEEAAAVKLEEIDFAQEAKVLESMTPLVREANQQVAQELRRVLAGAPALPNDELDARMARFRELADQFIASLPARGEELEAWRLDEPIPTWKTATSFLFGTRWLTASFWQDWYGIVPLFTGSLLVSLVALSFAIPLGVGAAIYVNQIASPREQRLIKPSIEFIAAFPSVVLGFFGIAVLGQALRALSQQEWLSWLPGFPYSERLNVLTAGCLLALIAVPTIFTLAEDALNNVPRAFREASFALGATRLQTIIRITIPASLSGIISAVLLGFGRVIGETMVVLLCAGNRIAIPDFSAGLAVVTQPVHTMTGIIAQEMGEVVQGSIHYRALFMVGLVLFFLSLSINYLAQRIVRRYRLSIG
jgi:phosphate transport system permease protein